MVPQERFELPTLALQKPCTTAVLLWHGMGLTITLPFFNWRVERFKVNH